MTERLLISLALTLVLEVPFAYIWGLRTRRELAVAVLCNVLTNPPVVLGHSLLVTAALWPPWLAAAVLEWAAVAAEWQCYRRCTDAHHPLALSLCANGFSYGAGLLLQILL